LLDAAGVGYHPEDFYGRSLMPILSGAADAVYGEDDAFAFEVSGNAALYRGDWKISRTLAPFGDGEWHLFDLSADPGETTDVAPDHPDLFKELLREYQAYASDVGVFELAPGQSARKQLTINALKKFGINYWYVCIAALAVIVAFSYGLYFATIRLLRHGTS
jgi:arylsulfatase/uncharacterized sulfatase